MGELFVAARETGMWLTSRKCSLALFTLYLDNLLQYLASCNVGCYLGHKAVNSYMYADDIILFSISVKRHA